MAVAEVDIYNMALSAIGVTSTVAMTTENSLEARVCSTWYEQTRNSIMRAAPWSSLKAAARLALKATRDDDLSWEPTDPTPGFTYAYNLPSDMIHPRYLTSFAKFEIASTADGRRALMTDQDLAILIYNRLVTDPSVWDTGLVTCIVQALAARIVKPLTGNTTDLSPYVSLAQSELAGARQLDAPFEGTRMVEVLPEWLAARCSAYGAPFSPFIFPFADPLLGGSLGNVS